MIVGNRHCYKMLVPTSQDKSTENNMKKHWRAACVTSLMLIMLAFGATRCAQAAESNYDYLLAERKDLILGMEKLNSGSGYSQLWKIYGQLVRHSDQRYSVYLGQTWAWGMSYHGGYIILDVSTVGKPDDQLAFILAHEWGHQALGHQANIYHPYGDIWKYRPLPTSKEDEADEYAGRFLARFGYDANAVAEYLRNLPESPAGDTHSTGSIRAQTVLRAYNRVAGGGGQVSTESKTRVACYQCQSGYIVVNNRCSGCNGRGLLFDLSCGGRGMVADNYGRVFRHAACGGTGKLIDLTCGGSGVITSRQRCQNCGGRGYKYSGE